MAQSNLAHGPLGIAQITAKSTAMKAIGTLAPIEPEMTRIYAARAESCLSKAREAAIHGRVDAKQHFLDEAKFWRSHAEAITGGLRGHTV